MVTYNPIKILLGDLEVTQEESNKILTYIQRERACKTKVISNKIELKEFRDYDLSDLNQPPSVEWTICSNNSLIFGTI